MIMINMRFFILFIILISFGAKAQKKQLEYATFENSTYTPQYTGSTYDEIRDAQRDLNRRYDQNRDKKDQLQNWVYELRAKQTDQDFKESLDFVQNWLDLIEKDGGYESLGNEIRKVENSIRKSISEYNLRIAKSANATPTGRVNVVSYAPIYSLPSTNSTMLIRVIKEPVTIVGKEENGFYPVECDGQKGFIEINKIIK